MNLIISGCREPSDLVLALDASTSIGYDQYTYLLGFARHFATVLNIGPSKTRLGIETYADSALARFQLNTYSSKTDVINAISFPFMKGKTMTSAALKLMRENMFSGEY